MRLSHKFKPDLSHKEQQIIQELSYHTSKLYNIANYAIKNNEDIRPVYRKLDKQFKDNWHCDFLMAHNRQHCLKQLAKDWKSYFNNLKRYKANPDGVDGKPKPPGFKHMNSNPNDIICTNEVARLKGNNLVISLQTGIKDKYKVKELKFELPPAIQSLTNLNALQQVKIKYDNLSGDWYFLLIYKVQEKDKPQGNNVMSIDLGLDNLATIVFEQNIDSYIINGKTIKSKNKYYNQQINHLQSIRMKQTGSKHFKDTRKIKNLRLKRRNYINDYLHKASKKIIDLAQKHNVNKIVIGDLKNIKQGLDNNKDFVAIPIQRLKKLIEYKAKLAGIEVNIINEAFTSGCSALDLEELNKDNYDKSRRIERGLFITIDNIKINADVNGALNILRKFLNSTPFSVKRRMDKGAVGPPPQRIRIA